MSKERIIETWLSYDKDGKLIVEKNSKGIVKSFEYDENDNVIKIAYNDSRETVIQYNDKNEEMYWEVIINGKVAKRQTCSYNEDGQIDEIRLTENNVNKYLYDVVTGKLSTVIYNDGSKCTFNYDDNGNQIMSTHGNKQYVMVYDNNNNCIIKSSNTGFTAEYEYDSNNNLIYSKEQSR